MKLIPPTDPNVPRGCDQKQMPAKCIFFSALTYPVHLLADIGAVNVEIAITARHVQPQGVVAVGNICNLVKIK